jgi:excisionase family DNA binding protein
MHDAEKSPAPRTLLTVEEAAERLAIGRTTVFALLKTGQLQSVQIGRLRRIPLEALDEYAQTLRHEQRTRNN